ncbi:MAG: hypothetical protein SCM11_04660 [Bacillota bacterium]|nr:hypothetical protein [Bacillota bacterium]
MEQDRDFVICHNKEKADIRFQDGALRHAAGVKNYQVLRACRDVAIAPDGCGWTYNHAPMLAWWQNRFFLQYLSDPVSEHVPLSQTLLVTSADGRVWDKPRVVFPPLEVDTRPYRGPHKELLPERAPCIMHQRAAFYVTSDDRLLMTAFYGLSPEPHTAPNNGYGVGRVVREIYPDLSLSDLFFIRCNTPGGFTRTNTRELFPDYRTSPDAAFVAACDELLAHPLATQQWWEEERLDQDFFRIPAGQALSYYTLPDGTLIGVFKGSRVSRSVDGGQTWSPAQTDHSIETATGKVWGQRTEDGRYALVYNPSTDGQHRWPLAVVSGDNGTDFDMLLALTPEVSPCRWQGLMKNLGPQYVRGICESNPRPRDASMWLTYSVNKEDIWVCQAPVPLRGTVDGPVNDDFSRDVAGALDLWNLYVPAWTSAGLDTVPVDGGEKIQTALCLRDHDPYDRVRAMRLFAPADQVRLSFSLRVETVAPGASVVIELQDRHGSAPVRIKINGDGQIAVRSGGVDFPVVQDCIRRWLTIDLQADCRKNRCAVQILDREILLYSGSAAFSASVWQLERILFASKAVLPWQSLNDCGKWGDLGDLPGADQPTEETRFAIGRLAVLTPDLHSNTPPGQQ